MLSELEFVELASVKIDFATNIKSGHEPGYLTNDNNRVLTPDNASRHTAKTTHTPVLGQIIVFSTRIRYASNEHIGQSQKGEKNL